MSSFLWDSRARTLSTSNGSVSDASSAPSPLGASFPGSLFMQRMALGLFLVLSSTQNGIHWWSLGWLKRDTPGRGVGRGGTVGGARRTGFRWGCHLEVTNRHGIQALNPLGSPAAL